MRRIPPGRIENFDRGGNARQAVVVGAVSLADLEKPQNLGRSVEAAHFGNVRQRTLDRIRFETESSQVWQGD
jgi:hypothetical protein